MMIDPISTSGLKLPSVTGAGRADTAISPAGGAGAALDFAGLLGDAIAGVAEKLRGAEAMSISGIKGMASTQDVVEKVMAAEQSLQAAIAVRDKVVSAYMEISRMAI
jgi:flagellar hook-basal body complex protein FliE